MKVYIVLVYRGQNMDISVFDTKEKAEIFFAEKSKRCLCEIKEKDVI